MRTLVMGGSRSMGLAVAAAALDLVGS
jgi:hypothetical protein